MGMDKREKDLADKLERILEPFWDAEDCKENRDKLHTIARQYLPYLTEEDITYFCDNVLGAKDESILGAEAYVEAARLLNAKLN